MLLLFAKNLKLFTSRALVTRIKRFASVAFFICLLTLTNTNLVNANESFDKYEGLSHRVMSILGNAKQRVWLRTTYLTDGDVVMGLNMAKFRGLDVRVVLHSKKLKHYMSRYTTLRKQRIPTKVSGGEWRHKTNILVDDKLYNIQAPMDYRSGVRYIRLKSQTGKPVSLFKDEFAKISKIGSFIGSKSTPKLKSKPIVSKPIIRKTKVDGKPSKKVYTYSNKKEKAPRGLPTKLPRKTKWQLNRQR